MAEPAVSIIIVNYNGKHLLANCLDAVRRQTGVPFETIMVDNGSRDGSAEFVRQNYAEVRVVEAGSNLGFAGGNNLGVRHSNTDLVVLLNNDTVVGQNWLAPLVRSVEAPDVAVASSFVITRGIPERFYRRNGSLNLLGHNIMEVFSRPENLFYCSGASLIFKRDLFGEPFDPEYFAYCEDVYLGLRARFMGMRLIHVNDSLVDHLGGATIGSKKSRRIWMFQERNRVLNLLLFFTPWTVLRVLPVLVVSMAAKFGLALFSPRYRLPGLIHAWFWLLTHPGFVLRRRRSLAREKRVEESEVISWMSARVVPGDSVASRLLNGVTVAYFRAVGLRTVESLPEGTR